MKVVLLEGPLAGHCEDLTLPGGTLEVVHGPSIRRIVLLEELQHMAEVSPLPYEERRSRLVGMLMDASVLVYKATPRRVISTITREPRFYTYCSSSPLWVSEGLNGITIAKAEVPDSPWGAY